MSVLDGVGTVLLAHAHPDDESVSTGALVVELVARGVRVVLLTATGGERGEVVPGSSSAAEASPELVAVRADELAAALDVLGIRDAQRLGAAPARAAGVPDRLYRDSGMEWVSDGVAGPAADVDVDVDALSIAPFDEVVADVAAALTATAPDLVVSYDDLGGYGHPDHIRIREAALAAARAEGVPFAEVLDARPACDRPADAEWFELPQHLARVAAALDRHRTQLTVDGADIVHVGGHRQAIPISFGLRAV